MGSWQSKRVKQETDLPTHVTVLAPTYPLNETDDRASFRAHQIPRSSQENTYHLSIKPTRIRRRSVDLPRSLRSGLFSSFPAIYLTPSVAKHIRHILRLYGATIRQTPDDVSTICIVAGRDDRMIPTLYLRGSGVFRAEWAEACFVAGVIVPLEEFIVWPWEYSGAKKYVPEEVFDFSPVKMEDGPIDQEAGTVVDSHALQETPRTFDDIFKTGYQDSKEIPAVFASDAPEQRHQDLASSVYPSTEPDSTNDVQPRGNLGKRKMPLTSKLASSAKRAKAFDVYQDTPELVNSGQSTNCTVLDDFAAFVSAVHPASERCSPHRPSELSFSSGRRGRSIGSYSLTPKHPFHAPSSVRLTLYSPETSSSCRSSIHRPQRAHDKILNTPPGSPAASKWALGSARTPHKRPNEALAASRYRDSVDSTTAVRSLTSGLKLDGHVPPPYHRDGLPAKVSHVHSVDRNHPPQSYISPTFGPYPLSASQSSLCPITKPTNINPSRPSGGRGQYPQTIQAGPVTKRKNRP